MYKYDLDNLVEFVNENLMYKYDSERIYRTSLSRPIKDYIQRYKCPKIIKLGMGWNVFIAVCSSKYITDNFPPIMDNMIEDESGTFASHRWWYKILDTLIKSRNWSNTLYLLKFLRDNITVNFSRCGDWIFNVLYFGGPEEIVYLLIPYIDWSRNTNICIEELLEFDNIKLNKSIISFHART